MKKLLIAEIFKKALVMKLLLSDIRDAVAR